MGTQVEYDSETISTILNVIEYDIVPVTRQGVAQGCKVFGAAVLKKSDLSPVVIATNRESANPLYHGEVSAINDFYALKDRPDAKDCVFVATHEPCSLCLSAITWGGFDNFSYFFTYEDTRDEFAIPYDIDILKAVYHVSDSNSQDHPPYNRVNKFFRSKSLKDVIHQLNDETLEERAHSITNIYKGLSDTYQEHKGTLVLP